MDKKKRDKIETVVILGIAVSIFAILIIGAHYMNDTVTCIDCKIPIKAYTCTQHTVWFYPEEYGPIQVSYKHIELIFDVKTEDEMYIEGKEYIILRTGEPYGVGCGCGSTEYAICKFHIPKGTWCKCG